MTRPALFCRLKWSLILTGRGNSSLKHHMSQNTPQIEPRLGVSGSFDGEYFDLLYAQRSDPWDFATSPYEAAKYAATLAALPKPRYKNALELGCSIGVLTQQLAPRC